MPDNQVQQHPSANNTLWVLIALTGLAIGLLYTDVGSAPPNTPKAPTVKRITHMPKNSMWTHIVIHHSGTDQGSAKSMDTYHRKKRNMPNGLAYHFVIGNGHGRGTKNGVLEVGHRWKKQIAGGHLKDEHEISQISIGICLIGNFNKYSPTPAQWQTLRTLVSDLQQVYTIPQDKVLLHRDCTTTACPGKHFPDGVADFSTDAAAITEGGH